jgi:hypothetical protein
MLALIVVANEYNLNPFTKEIYAFPSDGGITPIVSVDGWMRIINDHPQLDGIEFKEKFIEDKIHSVTCIISRKDRSKPTRVTEYYKECQKNTEPWNKWPVRMLRHKAAIQCARYAFSFSGIYDPDEGARIAESQSSYDSQDASQYQEEAAAPEESNNPAYSEEKFKVVLKAVASGRKTAADAIGTIQSKFTLTEAQISDLESAEAIEGEIITDGET